MSPGWNIYAVVRTDLPLQNHVVISNWFLTRQLGRDKMQLALSSWTRPSHALTAPLCWSDLAKSQKCLQITLKLNSSFQTLIGFQCFSINADTWCRLCIDVTILVKWIFKCCFGHPIPATVSLITMWNQSLNLQEWMQSKVNFQYQCNSMKLNSAVFERLVVLRYNLLNLFLLICCMYS